MPVRFTFGRDSLMIKVPSENQYRSGREAIDRYLNDRL